ALAERAQVAVRIEAAAVAVEPLQPQGVVADRLDLVELLLDAARLDEGDRPRVPLAPGARAITAHDLVRVDSFMAVPPLDLGHLRAARAAHGDALRSKIHDYLLRFRFTDFADPAGAAFTRGVRAPFCFAGFANARSAAFVICALTASRSRTPV